MAAANNHNNSTSSSSFFLYRSYSHCCGFRSSSSSSDRRRKGFGQEGSGSSSYGDGVWSGRNGGGGWRRDGRAWVSYSSPDGTPFYYPGEGFADLGIHPEKLLQPGDPETFQVKIRDVMPVGYFVDMPSGREGYLPANDLGFSGGIERLRTIFQVGQEVTVRITFRGGGGRELLSIRKFDPDRPPVEPPKVARSSGSGKRKISSMMRRRAQQQQQQQQQAGGGTSY
jgi:predicted RNA-binding protein with RPS1 domain